MAEPIFASLPDGRRIATRFAPGAGPVAVFLPGYMSDMAGGKASAVFGHCARNGRACLLLDYSGCGQSDGDFADGTLTRWRAEVLAAIDHHAPDRPVVLIGSSMGGWLMLLAGLALGDRLAGMIGIAAAPDFTEWGYDARQKAALAAGETVFENNPYGPEPTPTHAAFWRDAQGHRLLDAPIPIAAPARLLHGQADADVPWRTSLRLADALGGADVATILVKDGDHRLSRDRDIARLLTLLDELT